MTRATLIKVPYHLGRRGDGLAKGVPVLAETLADERADMVSLDAPSRATNEIGDFNTPDTTGSGFFDGIARAARAVYERILAARAVTV
jgi:hypothetical protein